MFYQLTRTFPAISRLSLLLILSGCAGKSFVAPVADLSTFVDRGVTQTQGDLRVTAAVPDAEETRAIFGLDLYSQGIQPVWLIAANLGEGPARFAPTSIEREYFSPLEVAWNNRKPYNWQGRIAMERWFLENRMPRQLPAGETRSGFVLTPLVRGTKGFNVDFYTKDESANFTFFIPIPGFRADYMDIDFKNLYTADEIQTLDREGLRQALKNLPCCSTDHSGSAEGDPFNVSLVGTGIALRRALLRGGWQETAAGSPETALARTHRYRGRQPDGTFHKSRPDGSERKELRLWLTPMLVEDKPVWLGQVSYDMAGEADTTSSFENYHIDPDIDDARMFMMQNFWYSQSLSHMGLVSAGTGSTMETPRFNFLGSEYFTDGKRVVLFVSESPVALDEIILLNWSRLTTSTQETGQSPVAYEPPPNDRHFVNTIGDIRVTTAVPSAAETEKIFGITLYNQNIQPVWVKVENFSDEALWFLPVGLDESYFTPIETSYRRQGRISLLNLDRSTNQDFYDKRMRLQVNAGAERSGYIFSRVDEGTKSFNVDVMGANNQYRMTFYVPVPGLRLDHYDIDLKNIYREDEIADVDLAGLVSGLEALPCCVTDKKGKKTGDPLNIAIVGNIKDVYYAFMRAGWDETETIYGSSLWNTMKSTLLGSEYRYSPVSALYVFGRPQDAALQKARDNIDNRNHLRLWKAPMRYNGKPVWIGQISRDIGVRFTWETITTHKIDANVDETREYLLEDLAYAQSLEKLGYVRGVGVETFDSPRGNLTGDPWFTDGLRVVLFVSDQPVSISDIEVLDLGSRPDL